MSSDTAINLSWDDTPIEDSEANFIWNIANKLRGSYMPERYGDVIIPMTIIRRLECTLAKTKDVVLAKCEHFGNIPPKILEHDSGFPFYNVSGFTLEKLCSDPDNLATNFESYIDAFSKNVRTILEELSMKSHIEKMAKDGCLYGVVKDFAALDLSPETVDSVKMGYIFENLIGRFYQNVDAGQYYTGRDIIKLMGPILLSEGSEDILDSSNSPVVTICDQACGTGGMLSVMHSYISHINPNAEIHLFGQEFADQSYAIGLAEMLIKNQDATNFRHADTLKEDCFKGRQMRFVIENPPFGVPWGGKNAKDGQEDAVVEEAEKGYSGRFPAGVPGKGDAQLLFLQSAVNKMRDDNGRCAIIENGSPLTSGNAKSGESQIRLWLLKNDLIEAIIQLPKDLFYNTGLTTYIWVLSKNKRPERKGKIQLIDASGIYHKLRKPLGDKKVEFRAEDRAKIVKLYTDFKENELSQIHDNTEFMYREVTIEVPKQRSHGITDERIENALVAKPLSSLYNEAKVLEFEAKGDLTSKEKTAYKKYLDNKPLYDEIVSVLRDNVCNDAWQKPSDFAVHLEGVLRNIEMPDKKKRKFISDLAEALSLVDKSCPIQVNGKGKTIYEKDTDTERIPFNEDVDTYLAQEVLPYVPLAHRKAGADKIGAEIPFTRYFYKYEKPESSEELAKKFEELEASVSSRIAALFE